MLKEINDKSNRNAHARNFTSFCGINSIKIPGAIDVEIYIHLFPSFGPLILVFYRIQNLGWLKITRIMGFKEIIIVLSLTRPRRRYKDELYLLSMVFMV